MTLASPFLRLLVLAWLVLGVVVSCGGDPIAGAAADYHGRMLPVLLRNQELAQEFDGRVEFGQVDVDKNPQIPTNYNVRAIPTLLMFKDGDVVGQLTGAHPKGKIQEMIEGAL